MSKQYQTSATASDFQKATFSFWFRIPTSAAATAAAPGKNGLAGTPGQWRGGIELLTFGSHNESAFFEDSYSSINLSLGDFANGWASNSSTFSSSPDFTVNIGDRDDTG